MNTDGAYECTRGSQCQEPGYAFSDITGRCEGKELAENVESFPDRFSNLCLSTSVLLVIYHKKRHSAQRFIIW